MGTVNAGENATALEFNNSVLAQNYIVNGNFDIWQRNTTKTDPTHNSYNVADRWKQMTYADSGTLPTIIHSRQSLALEELAKSQFFYRVNPNGAGSGFGADAYAGIRQFIENGLRFLAGSGRTVTVSFYAKSDITSKKIGIHLRQNYGSGGTPSSEDGVNGTYWVLSSSWTRYEYTFTLSSLASKTLGTNNDDALIVQIMYMWGSSSKAFVGDTVAEDFVSSGNIDIAQVQLNIGETALEFKPRQHGIENDLCERFYWTKTVRTINGIMYYQFPTTMRTTPSVAATVGTIANATANGFQITHTSNTDSVVTADAEV